MKHVPKPAAVAVVVDLGAAAVAADLAAAAVVEAVAVAAETVAGAVDMAEAAAVVVAVAENTKINLASKRDAVSAASLFISKSYTNMDYTNSTAGLCGIIPARYPISSSFSTASLPSSP
jgi:hypothetical protein